MAEFASIPFFEQTGLAGQQELYSPVFDVAAYGQLVAALKVVALAGTSKSVDVNIEHSMDMDKWESLIAFSGVSSSPALEITDGTKFARYVRAFVDTSGGSTDQTVTFSLLGIARDIG